MRNEISRHPERVPESFSGLWRYYRPLGRKRVLAVLLGRALRPLSKIRTGSKGRHILLFGHSRVIVQHLLRLCSAVGAGAGGNEVSIVIFGTSDALGAELQQLCQAQGVRPIAPWQVALKRWDLCVVADHSYFEEIVPNGTPVVFIYHGMGSIKKVNGENYKYGESFVRTRNGALKYDMMFEAGAFQQNYVERLHPELSEVIEVVGDLEVEHFLNALERRELLRAECGYAEDDRVILIQTTWGENSLDQRLGESLAELCGALSDTRGVKFIYSTHPNHWGGNPNVEDRSPRYLALETEFFRVLRPAEDRHVAMAVADICVSDITTLATVFAFSNRELIFSVGDIGDLDEDSEMAALIKRCPGAESVHEVEQAIEKALETPGTLSHEAQKLLPDLCRNPGNSGVQMQAALEKVIGGSLMK